MLQVMSLMLLAAQQPFSGNSSQSEIISLVTLLCVLPLLAFWVWMFRDMTKNDSLPKSARDTWMLLFIVLNVFGAAFYYVQEYRTRR